MLFIINSLKKLSNKIGNLRKIFEQEVWLMKKLLDVCDIPFDKTLKDKSALACPAEITPAATFRCTDGGKFKSRMVLVIAGRDLLNLTANSSWVF